MLNKVINNNSQTVLVGFDLAGVAQLAESPYCKRCVPGSSPGSGCAGIAQLAERRFRKAEVVGSTPTPSCTL